MISEPVTLSIAPPLTFTSPLEMATVGMVSWFSVAFPKVKWPVAAAAATAAERKTID